jgi:hypothetical protein
MAGVEGIEDRRLADGIEGIIGRSKHIVEQGDLMRGFAGFSFCR